MEPGRMFRLHLIPLTVVALVAITFCFLLSTTNAESLEDIIVQAPNSKSLSVEWGKVRKTREAASGKGKKNRRKKNSTKKSKKKRNKNRGKNGKKNKTTKKEFKEKKTKSGGNGKGRQNQIRKKGSKESQGTKEKKKKIRFRNKLKKEQKKKKKTKKNGKGRQNQIGKKGKKESQGTKEMTKKMKIRNKLKKEQKKRKKTKKDGKGKVSRQSDSCVMDLNKLLTSTGGSLNTLEKFLKRIGFDTNIISKKEAKKGEFDGNRKALLRALGSSSSDPTCHGKAADPADVEFLRTLESCSVSVEVKCGYKLTQQIQNTIDNCQTVYDNAMANLALLKNKSDSSSLCDTVSGIPSDQVKDVNDCKNTLLPVINKTREQKFECIKGFQLCRQAERAALNIMYKCFDTLANAENEKETLSRIKDALDKTINKLDEALNEAGLATGPGADGQVSKQAVSNDDPRCEAVLNGLIASNKSAEAAINSVTDPLDPIAANSSISDLQAIADRSDLAGDLNSCKKVKQGTEVLVIFQIRIYLFWSRQWRQTVIIVRITIITIIIPTLPTTSPTTIILPTSHTTTHTTDEITIEP